MEREVWGVCELIGDEDSGERGGYCRWLGRSCADTVDGMAGY